MCNAAHLIKSLNALPATLELDLDTVTALELVNHKAKWHRWCHLKLSTSKPKKAEGKSKRVNTDDQQPEQVI